MVSVPSTSVVRSLVTFVSQVVGSTPNCFRIDEVSCEFWDWAWLDDFSYAFSNCE